MYTICSNAECLQKYKIKEEMLGAKGRCKKCNTIFELKEFVFEPKVVDLEYDPNEDVPDDEDTEEQSEDGKRRRRSPKEVMDRKITKIKKAVNLFLPNLHHALDRNVNESDTRLLINQMLQSILGYNIDEIKTEQNIEGRRADYVISLKNEDKFVIESKKIGMALRERQVFQATSYGAYASIKWAILTNAVVWQLYKISTVDKVETHLIFNIDLRDGLDDQEAQYFYFISKHGMSRKMLLEKYWKKVSALCYDNIVRAILSDEVITRIRKTLSKQTGYRVKQDELREAIEANILQL